MKYETWCMMYDVWCMMYEIWYTMYDVYYYKENKTLLLQGTRRKHTIKTNPLTQSGRSNKLVRVYVCGLYVCWMCVCVLSVCMYVVYVCVLIPESKTLESLWHSSPLMKDKQPYYISSVQRDWGDVVWDNQCIEYVRSPTHTQTDRQTETNRDKQQQIYTVG